jgi:type VI secretion system protein ImpG
MEPDFLKYYTRELLYMREMMQEFAQDHPKVARRLGIQAGEIGDPYVERLIEAFAWESARSQLRIDAAFPQFTQRLLETVYPNYVRPTPSMSVARIFPNATEGTVSGFLIERGAEFLSTHIPRGEQTPCIFTTSQDVTLYPLEIVRARYTGIPPDIPSLNRWIPADRQVRGALRLTLRTTRACPIAELRNLDRLPIYLAAEEPIALRLFELIHGASLATIIGAPGTFGDTGTPFHAVSVDAVVHEAMEPGQGMLPLYWEKFHGYNLLHEYFACPSRFYFFTLTNLQKGLAKIKQSEVEIVILLDQPPSELAHQVDASQFALFCTPVINLFCREENVLPLRFKDNEAPLVPDVLHPEDYEIFAIGQLHAFAEHDSERFEFMPRDAALLQDEGNDERYFALRRETVAPVSGSNRRYGTHMPYMFTHVYLSLLDGLSQPYTGMNYARIRLWLTNADLPGLLEYNGKDDLRPAANAMPIGSTGLIRQPSMPWSPLAQGDTAWKLASQLNLHASSFYTTRNEDAARGLRKRLQLFIPLGNAQRSREIDSIVDFQMEPVTRKLPGIGPLRFGRGMCIRLTVDEADFGDTSPYLFGRVLECWLARLVSQNSFIQVDLYTPQRGKIASWPVHMGTRNML